MKRHATRVMDEDAMCETLVVSTPSVSLAGFLSFAVRDFKQI